MNTVGYCGGWIAARTVARIAPDRGATNSDARDTNCVGGAGQGAGGEVGTMELAGTLERDLTPTGQR
jgi:hypothetical protein